MKVHAHVCLTSTQALSIQLSLLLLPSCKTPLPLLSCCMAMRRLFAAMPAGYQGIAQRP
jgi:hypothetical protein